MTRRLYKTLWQRKYREEHRKLTFDSFCQMDQKKRFEIIKKLVKEQEAVYAARDDAAAKGQSWGNSHGTKLYRTNRGAHGRLEVAILHVPILPKQACSHSLDARQGN